MRLSSLPTVGLLAALALTGCNCDPDVVTVAPQIAVDVCKVPERIVKGKNVGGVQDCEIDFGDKDISVMNQYQVKITNVTAIPLNIEKIELPEGLSDPAFRIISAPTEVLPGITNTMVVGFRPNVEADVEGVIKITSDAANVEDGVVVIHLHGRGVDNGIPDIRVSSPNCASGADPNLTLDFGRVGTGGGVAQCTLTIENLGTRALNLDGTEFLELVLPDGSAEGTVPFNFVGRPPQPDDEIPPLADAPNNKADVVMSFAPDTLGDYSQKLRIFSNDPDRLQLDLPLIGSGVTPPLCGAKLLTVNGQPADEDTSIEPLDDVIMSAEDSEPSTTSGSIDRYEWEIVDVPPGSHVQLTSEDQPTSGFQFADGTPGVDLAGRYKVKVAVIDDLDTKSVNECIIEFEAIPTDTFLAQLSWDTPTGDMDLHVAKMNDNGDFCISGNRGIPPGPLAQECEPDLDCNYATCKVTSLGRPDWDDTGNLSEGDPSLDIDDISGYGPENINVDQSVPGDYLVAVFYYNGAVDVGNTVRIYVHGLLQQEHFKILSDDDWWEVAILHWQNLTDGQEWCLEDLDDGDPNDDCGV